MSKNIEIVYSIIIPLYNEEEVIKESYKKIKHIMDSLKEDYELIFVNDGSKDRTLEFAKETFLNFLNIT